MSRSGVVQREDVTAGWSLCGSRARAMAQGEQNQRPSKTI